MSGFRTLAKIVLISVLLAAGCTPSLDTESASGITSPPMVVEGVVESVSLPGWVFLSESATGIETIEVTNQTRLADSQGNSTTLCWLQAGQSIQAAGEGFGSSLRATQITLEDYQTPDGGTVPSLSPGETP